MTSEPSLLNFTGDVEFIQTSGGSRPSPAKPQRSAVHPPVGLIDRSRTNTGCIEAKAGVGRRLMSFKDRWKSTLEAFSEMKVGQPCYLVAVCFAIHEMLTTAIQKLTETADVEIAMRIRHHLKC
jgi:hypothetical protein